MGKKLKEHLVEAVVCLLYGVIFWFAAIGIENQLSPKLGETKSDTTKVTIIGSIPYYKPVAKDSVVLRYERVKLAIGDDNPYDASLSLTKPVDSVGRVADSVSVECPSRRSGMGTVLILHG